MAEAAAIGEKRTHRDEDLESEFEFAPERKRGGWRGDPIATQKPANLVQVPSHAASMPSKEVLVAERDKEEWIARRYHYLSMDAYSRHKALVNQYLLSCGRGIEHFKRPTENDRNDYSVLAEEHRFLWEPEDKPETWEKRMAKTYYDKLFKEYAIADLSRYKENKIAMRWRVKKEVCEGKGQFACGNKTCARSDELLSWEVNFSYAEQGESKNALVKLRLCPKCSKKLNYHKKNSLWGGKKGKEEKKKSKKHRKRKAKGKLEKHSSGVTRSHDKDQDGDGGTEESGSSGDSEGEGPGGSEGGVASSPKGTDVWKKPAEVFLEKSQAEEFDDYFKDMLL